MSESSTLFLSCASGDEAEFAERLRTDLLSRGFPLANGMESADRVLAVLNRGSLDAREARREWEHALLFGRSLMVLLREPQGIPPELARVPTIDFHPGRPFDEAFSQLLSFLQDEPLPLGPLHNVPSLPLYFHPRREELQALSVKVMGGVRKPNELTSLRDPVAVTGPGGVGKSVLALLLARSAEARRAFFDGIVWLSLGAAPALAKRIEQVGVAFGDDPLGYAELEAGRARLIEVLANKACLLILDDVRETSAVESFLSLLGASCRVLLTTSEPAVLSQLSFLRAQAFALEPASPERAAQILSRWSGSEAPAAELVEACGFLPYSLALAGGIVRAGAASKDVATALAKLAQKSVPGVGPHPHADWAQGCPVRALKLAVEVLAQQDLAAARCFSELAVFPPGEAIPEAAVQRLWAAGPSVASTLEERALVRWDGALSPPAAGGGAPATNSGGVPGSRRLALHEIERDYLQNAVRNAPALHAKLLSGYRRSSPSGWASGPDDGYFFQHLAHHLTQAGAAPELQRLLGDFEWLQAKLRATDVKSLVADFDAVETPGEKLTASALRLSAYVLWRDPDQLASQLWGRLMNVPRPEVRELLRAAGEKKRGPWLRPLTASLTPPGGPLLRTLTGHLGWVTSVAVTPDGDRAVSASSDQTLKLWDLRQGHEIQTLTGHSGWVTSVVITADGRRAVTALVDRCLKVWDLLTGLEVTTLEGHTDWVTSVAISPDGKRAVSASWDQTLKIWDLESNREVMTLSGHTGGVTAVAMSPDGLRAVSSSNDKTVKLWDLETGREIRTLTGHQGWTLAVAFLPDGRQAISASSDQTLKVWDLETGAVLRTLTGHAREVTSVTVTGDGRRAVSGSSDLTLRVWDLEEGREIRTLAGHSGGVNSVAVTGDARLAVSASDDEALKVWDLESDPALDAAAGHNGGVNATVATRDGRRVLSASWDRTIKVWDPGTGKELGVLCGHTGEVTSVALTADGRYALSASRDKTLRVWDTSTGGVVSTLPTESVIVSIALTGDGRRAISAASDENVTVWDLARGESRTLSGHKDAVCAVAVTSGGRYALSASRDATLKVWDLERGVQLRTLRGHTDWVLAVALSGDGRHALSGSSDGTLKLWNLEALTEPRTLSGHASEVSAVALTPNGRRAASASREETVKVWDIETGTCLATFFAEGELATCTIMPDGAVVVAGDYLGRLHFLRLEGLP